MDRTQTTELLADLVRIESINPALVAGGSGEHRIAQYVVELLETAGLASELVEVAPGRFNALGTLRGHRPGRTLMFNGHLDTVGVAGMEDPFSARVSDGRLYGRGSQDMKGGLAASLIAVIELARENRAGKPGLPAGEIILAAVADEEHESLGTRALLKQGVRADAAIVMEPTALEVVTAHKGFAWAQIETVGRAAHGSRPEEGRDAIAFMGRVLVEMEKLQAELSARRPHPKLGCGSVHASLVSGGQELSSYPQQCRLSLERRLVPGETGKTFGQELKVILSSLAERDPQFVASQTMGYAVLALETPETSPIVETLLTCAEGIIGRRPKLGGQSFWTDAALLSEAGITSLLYGPGGSGLHSRTEYVSIDEVIRCAEVLRKCAQVFCAR